MTEAASRLPGGGKNPNKKCAISGQSKVRLFSGFTRSWNSRSPSVKPGLVFLEWSSARFAPWPRRRGGDVPCHRAQIRDPVPVSIYSVITGRWGESRLTIVWNSATFLASETAYLAFASRAEVVITTWYVQWIPRPSLESREEKGVN